VASDFDAVGAAVVLVVVLDDRPVVDTGVAVTVLDIGDAVAVVASSPGSSDPAVWSVTDPRMTNPAIAAAASTATVVTGAGLSPSLDARRR
jgi:hypothetical protein